MDNISCTVKFNNREVYSLRTAIRQNEFFSAQQQGLKPQYCFIVRAAEYDDEETLIYNGKRYAVYRTYEKGDNVEIYVTKKAGVR